MSMLAELKRRAASVTALHMDGVRVEVVAGTLEVDEAARLLRFDMPPRAAWDGPGAARSGAASVDAVRAAEFE